MKDWSFNQMIDKGNLMKRYNFLFLIIFTFMFSACMLEDDTQDSNIHAEIERDGGVYSVYWDDLNESIQKSPELEFVHEDLQEEYHYKYGPDLRYVNNSIYNFLIVIPVKSKIDLESKFKRRVYFEYSIVDYANVQYKNGYYHYKLYATSNYKASRFLLNDIKDQQIYIDYYDNGSHGEEIHYTTNKLTIPAKEFEEMLDRLGISHEKLEFQPDDK
jgi:hypothetical protein